MRTPEERIIDAIETENLSEFKVLLKKHFYEIMWMKTEDGYTAFEKIVKKGRYQFFELVLEELNTGKSNKIPDDMLNYFLDRAMALAYQYKQKGIIHLGLNNSYGVRARNVNSLLTQASCEDHTSYVQFLLKSGGCVNGEGWYFRNHECPGIFGTPLSAALEKNSVGTVRFLLENGAYLLPTLQNRMVCVGDVDNDLIQRLVKEDEKMAFLISLTRVRAHIFKAILEDDIASLYTILNQASRNFPAVYFELLFFSQNARGFTPMQEATQKGPEFTDALDRFYKLTQADFPESRIRLPGETRLLSDEEKCALLTPIKPEEWAKVLTEQEKLLLSGAEPGSHGSTTNSEKMAKGLNNAIGFFQNNKHSDSEEDFFPHPENSGYQAVRPSFSASIFEAPPAVNAQPQRSLIAHNNSAAPSAPPLALIAETEEAIKAELNGKGF